MKKSFKKPFWLVFFLAPFWRQGKKQRFIKSFQQLGIDMKSFLSDDVGCFFGLLLAASPLASESLVPKQPDFLNHPAMISDTSSIRIFEGFQDAKPWLFGVWVDASQISGGPRGPTGNFGGRNLWCDCQMSFPLSFCQIENMDPMSCVPDVRNGSRWLLVSEGFFKVKVRYWLKFFVGRNSGRAEM